MEQNKREISLLDIMFKIFKHKILLISITLIVALISCWFLGVFSNQNKTSYNVSFYVSYPDTENLQLPDGTYFNYTDIISEEALNDVQNSSSEFSGVNIKKLTNGISISYEIEQVTKAKTQTTYTINVPTVAFPSKEVAKNFMKKLVNYPFVAILTSIEDLDYTNLFVDYEDENVSFDKKVAFLDSQKQFLLDVYDKTSQQFSKAVVDVQTISYHKQQINNYYNINSLDALEYEIATNGYAPKSDTLAQQYQSEIDKSCKQYETNLEEIAKIKDLISEIHSVNNNIQIHDTLQLEIVKLERANATLKEDIIMATKKVLYATDNETEITQIKQGVVDIQLEKPFKIDKQARTEFGTKMQEEFNQLKSFTQTCEDCVYNLYDKMLKTSFVSPSIVSLVGGTNKVLFALLSVLIGFVVASTTNIVVDAVQIRKKEMKEKGEN